MAMACIFDERSLSAARNMILPGVLAISQRAANEGIPIRNTDLWVDFANDELQLRVSYGLIRRSDMDRGRAHYIDDLAHRLNAAMRLFHRMPAAKALCVDRRRLNARGEQARKNKAKHK